MEIKRGDRTQVSAYVGYIKESNKGRLRSNEVDKSPRLHSIEHLTSHDKRILNADFPDETKD